MLPLEDILPLELLLDRVQGFQWVGARDSGRQIRSDGAAELHALWSEHLASLGIETAWLSTEEAEAQTYMEGDRTTVRVSRSERDPAARTACIEHYGTACSVCGMDFGSVYGPLGAGYIHVHHLNPLSVSGPTEVDPVQDLRPVCPNCHAMLHAGGLKSIEDLKRVIAELTVNT